MEQYNQLSELLTTLLGQLPSLLTLLVCMVIALTGWKRHPTVSLVLTSSLAFMFLTHVVFAVVYVIVLPQMLFDAGIYSRYSMQAIYTVLSFTYNLAVAIGFALLLVTIFMKRRPSSLTIPTAI